MRVFIASAGLCLLFLGSLPSTLLGQCSPDAEKPVIEGMPSNLTLNADADQCGATATWTLPTATDNCNLMSFVGSATPGSYFAVGTTLVTYTAMDASGNLEAESFTITVIDIQDPELDNVPGDITQAADANSCSTSVVWVAPDASDNCGIASTTSTHSSGDSFAFGTTTVTYTTTDVNGRTKTASFDVIVTATDTDGDGTCDGEDTDDDNDGVLDVNDDNSTDPNVCEDSDNDGCDDCSIGVDGFGPLADNTPANDGADSDGDGICDTGDNCSNTSACNFSDPANGTCQTLDECGVCGGSGIPTGECDCNGNVLDALDVCGGDCAADVDEDGVCDTDEIPGCTDENACNYNAAATEDDGSCESLSCAGCTDATACNYDASATIDDGSCESLTCAGCTDNTACNYDASATIDDGSCESLSCAGCTNSSACNYDASATIDDGSCESLTCAGCTDNTACNFDASATIDDGSCESLSCAGCTDATACNFDASATIDDGSCESLTCAGCTDNTACNFDASATIDDGSCESLSCAGCTDATACNFDASATIDDGSCESLSCAGCTDSAACNYDDTATIDDGSCESLSCAGCTDATACNYDASATIDDGSCESLTCAGCTDNTACNYDASATIDDGSCESLSCVGCTNSSACNYDASATIDDGSCESLTCAGCTDNTACNFDASATIDDGSCESLSCAGCTDATACNFDASATIDDGSCESLTCAGCTDNTACNYDASATNDDGSCESLSCAGCTDATACNYDASATIDDGSCESLSCAGCTDSAACNYDDTATIDDGSCESLSCAGCTNSSACNYDASATIDDGSCESLTCAGCTDNTACNYDASATIDDGSCESLSCAGCTDATACNFDASATIDDGSCESLTCAGCTDNTACNFDASATIDDGSCESLSCAGCTDATACNFDASATIDDGSCESLTCAGCTDNTACNYDASATIDDGSCESLTCAGCTDNTACNFDASATIDDGSCESLSCAGCTDSAACNYDASATIDDGSCESLSCAGCTNSSACNFDASATIDDGSCESLTCAGCTDNTACNFDASATIDDGSCESLSCAGCTDATACNYDASATIDDGSCATLDALNVCGGSCAADEDADGICDDVDNCSDTSACNYADTDDVACITPTGCETCSDATGTGIIVDNDQDDDNTCDALDGCPTDPAKTAPGTCGCGVVDVDIDGDGVCDDGTDLCTDTNACNYADPGNGSCITATGCESCTNSDGTGGVDANDNDNDGTCNNADGCPNDAAKTAPGICGCGNVDTDVDSDGVCDDNDLCTDPLANNYQSAGGEECAPCPDAPVFDGIDIESFATTMSSADGNIALNISSGNADTLFLFGQNGAGNLTIELPSDLDNIPAGYYTAMVMDDDGCIGVGQLSPGGTTLQQPGITRPLIVPYALCCSGCGINDTDSDGICDDDDNCTDQTACNFDDDCNEPCVYPDGNGDCTGYGDCSDCAGGYLTPTSSNHLLFGDENGNLIGYDISTGTVTSAGPNDYDAGGSNDLQLMFFEEDNCTLYMGDSDGFALMDIGTGTVGQDIGDNESAGIWFDTSNGLGFEDLDAGETVDGVHFALSHDGDGYNVGSGNPLFTFEFVLDELYSPALTGFATPCTGCNPDASVTFTKTDYGSEQDAITPNVTIARGNSAGLYNAVTQSGWDWDFEGPQGTYWKWGATSVPGIYSNWRSAVNQDPQSAVGTTLSLWIPEGNLFFDVEMLSWTCCSNGGGFSYTRTLVSEPTWETTLPGKIDATLLRMLPKDAANGSDWDWESLAMDLAAGYAYGVCDEDDTDTGYSDQELWRIDLNVNNTVQPTACPTCNPDAVVTFTKPDYSTSTVDQITPNVALARGDNQGYYNAMTQTGYSNSGPEGTYWKWGATGTPGVYGSWRDAHGGNADNQVGNIMSLWIPEGNLFFDIETTSWTCCSDGGGFSYTRTLVSAPAEAPEVASYDGMEHMGRISDDVSAMIFANGALYVGFENGNIGRLNLSGLSFTEDILATGVLPVDITAVLAGLKP